MRVVGESIFEAIIAMESSTRLGGMMAAAFITSASAPTVTAPVTKSEACMASLGGREVYLTFE